MISEMTDESHPSFDMLCSIADKTLRSKVKYWCATDPVLSDRDVAEDIMQNIFCRLIKTTITHFLKRKDCDGQNTRDPDGFKSWMFKVAENIKNDTAKSLRNRDFKTRGFEDGEEEQIPEAQSDDEYEIYRREKLAEAFQIVLDSDARVYKVLTLLAQSLFILEYDITRIQSNYAIISAFSEKSLFEMRDIVLKFACKIQWIVITPKQIDKINRALNAELNNIRIGEIKYKDFFMKKGGKASISDWINRMDKLIESRMKK